MSTETDSEEQPKKGRSNAILTYETISNVEKNLLQVGAKLDHLTEKVGDIKAVHVKHEVRIQALELAHATVVAAGTSSKSVWLWVWGAMIALPGVLATILTLIEKL